MRLDRIALDFLQWLKSLVFPSAKDHRSFRLTWDYQEFGPTGLIQRITRNTPRAIATWAYTPRKDNLPSSQHYRYFLCLDSLHKDERNWQHTHRISIWKASPWGSFEDDGFDAEQAYTGLYDLSLNNQYADRWGRAVLQDLARSLLEIGAADGALAWENQIRLSIAQIIGRHRAPSDWKPWLEWQDWP